MLRILRAGSIAFLLAYGASGQSDSALPAAPHDKLPAPGCNQYILDTLPNDAFGWRQRACFWGDHLFTGSALFGAAFFAAIAQATNSPSEWPQGMDGYGRRIGTRYLQGMVKTSTDFVIGGLMSEDPRSKPPQLARIYHNDRIGCRPPTTVKGRIGQALLRPVWDSCEHRLAYGRIAGSFASGFVQLAWAPPSQNHVSDALKGSATAMGGYFGDSVTSEFAGDLMGWFGRLIAGDKAPKKP
jgi:hypothetical protein